MNSERDSNPMEIPFGQSPPLLTAFPNVKNILTLDKSALT